MGSISMDCLPDDLLVQILSLLPTKQAVRTSILSKRWRTLFAFTHNLDIDEPVFRYPVNTRKSFNDFADSSLALQGGRHIKKFSLKLTVTSNNEDEVDCWICNTLEHGVSELHLRITSILWCHLPSKVFTSTTLINLSLGTRQRITSLTSDTSFPALKILFLDSILFDGDQLADLFLAACPALEDLTLHYTFYPKYSLVISGKTIKKLSVTYNCNYHSNYSRIISLETPSLVDLYYSDYPWCEFPHCQLDSLAKATLDLHHRHYEEDDADVTNLISGIRNVKTLHLTSSAVEVISVCCKGGLPVFNNLTDLVFSSNKQGFRVFLPLLLERSPNLKTLVLSGLHRNTILRRHPFVGIQIPLNNQIKMLRIMEYQGSAHELKHISHLLLNMECLEVVKVYVAAEIDDPKKMNLTKEMLKLPTVSYNLKIQVIYASKTSRIDTEELAQSQSAVQDKSSPVTKPIDLNQETEKTTKPRTPAIHVPAKETGNAKETLLHRNRFESLSLCED